MTAYALRAEHRTFGEYLHLTATIVELVEGPQPRNILADDYAHDPYATVAATAQAGGDAGGEGPTYSYAWRIGLLDRELIPERQLAASIKTVRKISAGLDRISAKYGPPATFGAYCARIADVLALPILTGTTPDGDYTHGTYVLWSPGDAVAVIDGWTAAHWRKYHPSAA